ncbi:MAG: ComEC/Rec2 family competence protein [Ginsengibacter sp.]
MHQSAIPIWKSSPFVRLLLPIISGILIQYNFSLELSIIVVALISFSLVLLLFRLLPLALQFKLQVIQGLAIIFLITVSAALFTYIVDDRNLDSWYGHSYSKDSYLVVKINEPVQEKTRSYKAEGVILDLIIGDSVIACSGKLLLYFEKDSGNKIPLQYGSKIIFKKSLQEISNSGNPGAFNYKRYSAFQHIFHQAFLKKNDWTILKGVDQIAFMQFIYETRGKVLNVLKEYIHGTNELAIGEALLIGYKADLDKDLVQAYSNTGVVHIIAISGLHLGIIYFILMKLFERIDFFKRQKLLTGITILVCLWLFSLITGGSASVLRSAVMFTCVVAGKSFDKKTSVYNSLAASAFLLLCYNPYYLWDVGFQLSYCAVISIVMFQRPILNLFYVKKWWLKQLWNLVAISLAAQILTFPICIFYFHQFPIVFLLSNIVAVPLSTGILIGEIILIAMAKIAFIAKYLGIIVTALIFVMNYLITFINSLPFAVYEGISFTILTTLVIYIALFCFINWLTSKASKGLIASLLCLAVLLVLNAFTKWKVHSQEKMIVYNVPKYSAMDFSEGNSYQFIGDSSLLTDGMLQNFHLKPGRIQNHFANQVATLNNLSISNNLIYYHGKKILWVSTHDWLPLEEKLKIDVIILSKNPRISIQQLNKTFECQTFVFDASNSLWKIVQWTEECEQLHLRCHSVSTQGAFIMD